jgi:hypothetical protein
VANKKRGQREKEREEREKGEKEKRERERERRERKRREKKRRERERDFITVNLKTVFSVPDISVRMQVCVQFCYFC